MTLRQIITAILIGHNKPAEIIPPESLRTLNRFGKHYGF